MVRLKEHTTGAATDYYMLFQFLMVRLKVSVYTTNGAANRRFQFLMVRLKVFQNIKFTGDFIRFQFLMVRLKDW